VAGLGRKPFALEAVLREFAGLDAGEDIMPDETTILKFRHLLEKHHLAQSLFAETTARLGNRDYCCVRTR